MKKTLKLDPNKLTMGEARDLENITGKGFGKVFADIQSGNWSITDMAGLIWIARRKEEPDLAFETVMEMTLEEMGEIDLEVPEDTKRPPVVEIAS